MNFPAHPERHNFFIQMYTGDVRIIAEDREDIELKVDDLSNQAIEKIFDIQSTESSFSLKNRKQIHFNLDILKNIGKGAQFELLELKVPQHSIMEGDITLYSGDLDLNGLHLNCNMKMYAGDMRFHSCQMDKGTNINQFSGDIQLDETNGYINLKSKSGDFSFHNGKILGIKVNNLSGDIDVNGEFAFESNGTIRSLSGDICLEVENDADDLIITTMKKVENPNNQKVLKIQSTSGDLSVSGHEVIGKTTHNLGFGFEQVDLDDIGEKVERAVRKLELKLPKIGEVIKESVQGAMRKHPEETNIEVQSSARSKAVEQILSMLEAGKITADEANKLINSL